MAAKSATPRSSFKVLRQVGLTMVFVIFIVHVMSYTLTPPTTNQADTSGQMTHVMDSQKRITTTPSQAPQQTLSPTLWPSTNPSQSPSAGRRIFDDGLANDDNKNNSIPITYPHRYSKLHLEDIHAIPRSDKSIKQAQRDYGRIFIRNNALHFQNVWENRSTSSSNDKNALLFVHIGKCGGQSLRNSLNVSCYGPGLLKKHDTISECLMHDVQNNCPALNSATVALQHGNYIPGAAQGWNNLTGIVATVRNPLDRFVSWFYFNLKDLPSHRTNWRVNFFACFPGGVRDVVQILDNAYNNISNQSSECKTAALTTLHGLGPPNEINHMFHNLMWYTREVISRFPETIYIIRTSHLWEDVGTVNQLLGGNNNNISGMRVDHGTIRNGSTLPETGIHNLCCTLLEEMDAYRYLLHKAINNVSTEETLNLLWNQCQVSSMEELVNTCPEELLPINYRV